ncbi:hypothetical protein GCM10011611_13590 [Aliidongia dinghuensis]|uniref:DUF302 domain-containing protein n=1 Tax=Aliidongia dinghuensis TaxID=1867774 RepID=A0A8J2YRG0_9PROT|nr:DUF302 domain-containing protein [Aliidongia dinghuensis]GGF09395.1 hypothetical protein GCM10011611_13590 [Aliidongia dinghuensis]
MGQKAFGWGWRLALVPLLIVLPLAMAAPALADESEPESVGPYPGTISLQTGYPQADTVRRLEKSVRANGLTLVATVNSGGRGQTGASVILVSSGDYWGRILRVDQLAGMEMPIRLYVVDNGNRTSAVVYRTPSSIFALYDMPELDRLAGELDQVFAKVIDDAVGE